MMPASSFPLFLVATLWTVTATPAQNCAGATTGKVPLTDLGTGSYQGFPGGLYPTGLNTMPAAHAAAGLQQAQAVQPLDAAGQPNATGRIVLVSIGMSNTTQEFSTWVPISNADPQRNGRVTVVDCAQGGQDAPTIANPNANFWTVCVQRLTNAGVTAQQVQVAWLKEAVAGPQGGGVFPGHALQLQGYLATIAQNLKLKFPNIRLCYLSSRIYAGYATTTLNPEPYAYESGFSVRWVIEQQIAGSAALNFDPANGPVLAPWLAWGPYMWADGTNPRGDGLTWMCADFQPDGTHPGPAARAKVAGMLDSHFRTAPTATPWYLGGGGGSQQALFALYGSGCPDGTGPILMRSNGLPFLGNSAFRIGLSDARAGIPALLFLGLTRGNIALDPACTLLVDPLQLIAVLTLATGPGGSALVPLPVPADPSLQGGVAVAQWLAVDDQAPGLQFLGGGAMSAGAQLRLGTQ
jgi:hypothetical protein